MFSIAAVDQMHCDHLTFMSYRSNWHTFVSDEPVCYQTSWDVLLFILVSSFPAGKTAVEHVQWDYLCLRTWNSIWNEVFSNKFTVCMCFAAFKGLAVICICAKCSDFCLLSFTYAAWKEFLCPVLGSISLQIKHASVCLCHIIFNIPISKIMHNRIKQTLEGEMCAGGVKHLCSLSFRKL